MVQSAVTDATCGHSDHHAATTLRLGIDTSTVADLGRFVYNLVKSWVDVVGELDFGNGLHPLHCSANGKASNTLLGQGSVEDAILAKLSGQVH